MAEYLSESCRRVVVNVAFETAIGELSRLLREEGLSTLARIDVRDHFMRDQRHMFRLYEIIEAWSPELAVETIDRHLDAGVVLPTRFVIYELANGKTVVLASGPSEAMATSGQTSAESPALSSAAASEHDRVSRVLAKLQERCQAVPVATA